MRRSLAAVPLAVVAVTGCGGAGPVARPGPDPRAPVAGRMTPVEEPARSARSRRRARFTTARVVRRTALRARPGGRRLATLGRTTEFGSMRVLAVLRRRHGWLAVQAAELPNGRKGWVRASAVRLGGVDLSVHVDRSARRLSVRRGRRVLRRFSVAVGLPGSETPTGRFAVTDKLAMPPGTPYGCCAVALTGHQTALPSGWGGGDRLAVHGTNVPSSVGRAASLGCMRAHRADVRWLMRRLPLGTPVFIRA